MQPSLPTQPVAPTIVLVNNNRGPNFLVRILWFIFLGMWLGSIATSVGYFFCLTIIGLPLGLTILNMLPKIMTLRAPDQNVRVTTVGNTTTLEIGNKQRSFFVRAIYFILVGWWLGAIWIGIAWLLTILWIPTLGLSLAPAFLMFNRIPAIMTLRMK